MFTLIVLGGTLNGRKNKSRIVCYREPEPTSLFTVGVCTDDDKLVTVFTAFPGPLTPKELTDPRQSKRKYTRII